MTTTAPPVPSPSPSLSPVPSKPIPKATNRLWPLCIILTIPVGILGFQLGVKFLPTQRTTLLLRERISIAGAILSPVSAFIRLEEQTKTNNPPTNLTLIPPDYVKQLPSTIGDFDELTSIVIRNQPMTTLPDSIGDLTNLETLIIANTPLTRLPDSIGNLTNLKNLEIVGTNIQEIPNSIGNLKNLKALILAHNKIGSLPSTITYLSTLVELDLTGNTLTEIPKALPPYLKFIFLGGNSIPRKTLQSLDRSKVIIGVHY